MTSNSAEDRNALANAIARGIQKEQEALNQVRGPESRNSKIDPSASNNSDS